MVTDSLLGFFKYNQDKTITNKGAFVFDNVFGA